MSKKEKNTLIFDRLIEGLLILRRRALSCVAWLILIAAVLPLWAQASTTGLAHPLAQEMYKAGATNCAATAHQLASLVVHGPAPSLLQVAQQDVDRSLVEATVVVTQGKGQHSLVNMTFAPSQASGCGASLRWIRYIDKSCSKAAKKLYAGLKTQSLGDTGILLGMLGSQSQVILQPAGKGCLVVTDELVR